jgi:hypothetical protein
VREHRHQRGFDALSRHVRAQHSQRVAHVDHGSQPVTEEVVGVIKQAPKLPESEY